MSAMNEKVREIRGDVSPRLVERLRSALEREREYQKEQDLLDYVFALGFYLHDAEARRAELEAAGAETEEVYQALHQELAQIQGAYASARFALAEAARDHQNGGFANVGLRRENFATRNVLLPRLEGKRDELLRRREALLRALGEETR